MAELQGPAGGISSSHPRLLRRHPPEMGFHDLNLQLLGILNKPEISVQMASFRISSGTECTPRTKCRRAEGGKKKSEKPEQTGPSFIFSRTYSTTFHPLPATMTHTTAVIEYRLRTHVIERTNLSFTVNICSVVTGNGFGNAEVNEFQ